MNKIRLALVFALVVLLAGCASRPRPVAKPSAAEPVLDTAEYERAAKAGQDVFAIDPGESDVWILVDAAGPLAGLGHRHAISSRDLEGFALFSSGRSSADLRLALQALKVDDPAARRHLGFDDTISEDAIAGTRAHMLDSLQAGRYPALYVHIGELRAAKGSTTAVGSLYLHGTSNAIEVPVDVRRNDKELHISGSFQVRQTDYGITPYSALHGALQVADTLDVSFSLTGRRFRGK